MYININIDMNIGRLRGGRSGGGKCINCFEWAVGVSVGLLIWAGHWVGWAMGGRLGAPMCKTLCKVDIDMPQGTIFTRWAFLRPCFFSNESPTKSNTHGALGSKYASRAGASHVWRPTGCHFCSDNKHIAFCNANSKTSPKRNCWCWCRILAPKIGTSKTPLSIAILISQARYIPSGGVRQNPDFNPMPLA